MMTISLLVNGYCDVQEKEEMEERFGSSSENRLVVASSRNARNLDIRSLLVTLRLLRLL